VIRSRAARAGRRPRPHDTLAPRGNNGRNGAGLED
jgi:hypothetical protein